MGIIEQLQRLVVELRRTKDAIVAFPTIKPSQSYSIPFLAEVVRNEGRLEILNEILSYLENGVLEFAIGYGEALESRLNALAANPDKNIDVDREYPL